MAMKIENFQLISCPIGLVFASFCLLVCVLCQMTTEEVMTDEHATSFLQGLSTTSFHSKGKNIFRCNNRRCRYKIVCQYLPHLGKFKLTIPIAKHQCKLSSNMNPIPSKTICRVKKKGPVKSFRICETNIDVVPARFSPCQLHIINEWCVANDWDSKNCVLPSTNSLMLLQKRIGTSPSLSGLFHRRIQQHVGSKVAVVAWHFDDPNESSRWSQRVFHNTWRDALCFGTITGVNMNKGFVTRFDEVHKTKSWESVLKPAIIHWMDC